MEPYQKVAVHGLIKKDDKYLTLHRSDINDYKPNEWDIPGGSIEIGEATEEALTREVKEETNLEVKIVKPLFVCSNFQDGKRHQFWIVYECDYLSGDVKLNPDEHNEFRWLSPGEMKNLQKIYFLDKFYREKLS